MTPKMCTAEWITKMTESYNTLGLEPFLSSLTEPLASLRELYFNLLTSRLDCKL